MRPSKANGQQSAQDGAANDANQPELVTTQDGSLTICLTNRMPAFAEEQLERLYQSLYSSLPQFEVEGGIAGARAYVVSRGDEIVELWLYQVRGKEARVLNQSIAVGAEAAQRFAGAVFAAHDAVDMVSFHAVHGSLQGLRLPFQRVRCSDDSVLVLPQTDEAWLAGLGKATRKNLKRYLRRLQDEHPSFRYQVREKEAVAEQDVRAVIELNRARMRAKGKRPGIDDAQAERILALVKRCGMVGVATIDEKICAGAIAVRAGANYFSLVRAHDPAYDEYRLGLVGAYYLICACIARGAHELHFMWGRERHKTLLGAEERALHHVTVFRSRARALRHAGLIMEQALGSRLRHGKAWLVAKAKRNDDVYARLLNWLISAARKARR